MSRDFFCWLKLRWRGLFRRRLQETELERELQFHLEMLEAENIAAGMSPEEARFAARREFGGVEQNREACRDTWRPEAISGLLGDFAFAARSLRRSPGFTAVAAFTLALGIGVNAIMFSFVRDTFLRPRARDQQLDLVALYNSRAGAHRDFRRFSQAEFEAMRESTEVFTDVAAMGIQTSALGSGHNLQRRLIALVSENYFSLLAVQPAQGRFFTAEESRLGASIPVLVASHALWEQMGRPADFVGSTLRVDDLTYTVIGIAPKGFVGVHFSIGPYVWLPLGTAAQAAGWDLQKHTTTQFFLYAHLRPGLDLASAAAPLVAADRRLNALAPVNQSGARQIVLKAPSRTSLGANAPEDETFLPLFAALGMGLSLMVLLVACLNLGNMLLARGVARQKEIAIRLALGATRWRVVRGLLAEGLLIALLGGALSLVLGQWSNLLLFRASSDVFSSGLFALGQQSYLDTSVVLATLTFSLFATLAFSLWPALRVTRLTLLPDLKESPNGPSTAGRWGRLFSLGQVPLLAQIALSLTLLFSAALFIRSAQNAQSLDLGFNKEQQLVALLDYKPAHLEPDELRRRQQALLASASTLPGVTAAALASNVPYNFELPNRAIRAVQGATATPDDPNLASSSAGYTAVTRGYFTQLGIALLRGRDFTPEESAGNGGHPVAIIDETLGRALFGENDALGRHIVAGSNQPSAAALEIVGIVRSPRDAVFGDKVPRRIYRPFGQSPETNTYLHVRVPQPLALIESLRRNLSVIEPDARVLLVRPLAHFVEKNINMLTVQLSGVIFGVFGAIALLLSVIGVYGVKAHAVARRTREIGIRVALGARPRDVMVLILKQGAIQAGAGIALGLGLALLAGRGLSAMLYRVHPADPLALVASAALLTLAILLACWFPARRATKVDPLVAIRTE